MNNDRATRCQSEGSNIILERCIFELVYRITVTVLYKVFYSLHNMFAFDRSMRSYHSGIFDPENYTKVKSRTLICMIRFHIFQHVVKSESMIKKNTEFSSHEDTCMIGFSSSFINFFRLFIWYRIEINMMSKWSEKRKHHLHLLREQTKALFEQITEKQQRIVTNFFRYCVAKFVRFIFESEIYEDTCAFGFHS